MPITDTFNIALVKKNKLYSYARIQELNPTLGEHIRSATYLLTSK